MPEKTPPLVANLAGAILFFFVLLFIFAKWGPGIPFSVNQITTNRSDFFTVSAEGRVQTKPDSAEVTVGFTTNAKTLADAQNKANATINKVVEEIKKLGILADDIKTVNYSVNPEYSQGFSLGSGPSPEAIQIDPGPTYQPIPRATIISYNVSTSIQIKIRDLAKTNSVVDTATKNGANEVSGVRFTLADKEGALTQARQKAIDAAKKKAKQIAGQTGISLGKIVNIYENEGGNYGGGVMYAAKAVPDSGNQTQVEPGSTEIVVNVTLNYETR